MNYKTMLQQMINRLLIAMFSRGLEAPTREEAAEISRLRSEMRRAVEFSSDHSERHWVEVCRRLARLFLERDPREFLRWPIIQETTCVSQSPSILSELRLLRTGEWARWSDAISEDWVGSPPPYFAYPATSGNAIRQAYHLRMLEDRTGCDVRRLDKIFEFGGGYGGMCRVARRLGFRGRYVIFDLPLFCALQRYYLQSNRISVTDDEQNGTATACVSDIEALRPLIKDARTSLFLATWSLSEAPVALRKEILDLVSDFDYFAFAYGEHFAGVDNELFFSSYAESMPTIDWSRERIDHVAGSRYLFGARRRTDGV
jgi:hypothetical protein